VPLRLQANQRINAQADRAYRGTRGIQARHGCAATRDCGEPAPDFREAPHPSWPDWPLSKGSRTTSQYREDSRPRGVVPCRRPSQIYRSERVVGCGIIGARRTSSAHLHRPWRAKRINDLAAPTLPSAILTAAWADHGQRPRPAEPCPPKAKVVCSNHAGRASQIKHLTKSGRLAPVNR
jgi:hypothetical protein